MFITCITTWAAVLCVHVMSRGRGHSGLLDAGLAKELELWVQGDTLPRGNKVGVAEDGTWHPPPASVHAQAHRPVHAFMHAYQEFHFLRVSNVIGIGLQLNNTCP